MRVVITLRSGNKLSMSDFTHISYPDGSGTSKSIKEFEDFYLYDYLLTFVGKTQVISLDSKDIESIQILDITN